MIELFSDEKQIGEMPGRRLGVVTIYALLALAAVAITAWQHWAALTDSLWGDLMLFALVAASICVVALWLRALRRSVAPNRSLLLSVVVAFGLMFISLLFVR